MGEDLAAEDGAYLFEGHDPCQFYVVGLPASPSQCGTWTGEWLQHKFSARSFDGSGTGRPER